MFSLFTYFLIHLFLLIHFYMNWPYRRGNRQPFNFFSLEFHMCRPDEFFHKSYQRSWTRTSKMTCVPIHYTVRLLKYAKKCNFWAVLLYYTWQFFAIFNFREKSKKKISIFCEKWQKILARSLELLNSLPWF